MRDRRWLEVGGLLALVALGAALTTGRLPGVGSGGPQGDSAGPAPGRGILDPSPTASLHGGGGPGGGEGEFSFERVLEKIPERSDLTGGAFPSNFVIQVELAGGSHGSEGAASVAGVRVDMWHADSQGEYGTCQGWSTTDAQGRITFQTVRPSSYHHGEGPHVHLRVGGSDQDRASLQPGAPRLPVFSVHLPDEASADWFAFDGGMARLQAQQLDVRVESAPGCAGEAAVGGAAAPPGPGAP